MALDLGTPRASRWASMRVSRPRFLAAGFLAAAALCASCNTPTLPIPPPIVDSAHLAQVESTPPPDRAVGFTLEADACIERTQYFMVYNETKALGAFSARSADMRFRVTVRADAGDRAHLMCMLSLFDVGQDAVVTVE
jgi:hypothetical protein